MKRRAVWVALALSILPLLPLSQPIEPDRAWAAPPAQSTTAWTGTYFANRNLQGNPVFTRDDRELNFAWGTASPAPGLPADDFSVRWLRWFYVDTAGVWTLSVTADDGVRVFVDDLPVIDAWTDQTPLAHTARLDLTQAYHLVRVEYYDRSGNAQIQFQTISAMFPDWRGEYYDNLDLAGKPVFVRNDSAINFNFGTTGPGGGVSGADFSVRWLSSRQFDPGKYRFTTLTDDGVRLWVDNQLLVDQWRDQTIKAWTGEVALAGGTHLIRMEYFNHGGAALATLSWIPVPGSQELWRGEYFDNISLSGAADLVRDTVSVNYDWGAASPGPGIPAGTNWSARWKSTRTTSLAGYYTINVIADDGVRAWVDNNLLIDEWRDSSLAPHSATVYLTAGTHDWRVDFYQRSGAASLSVQIVPGASSPPLAQLNAASAADTIVDDNGDGFFKGGPANGWSEVPSGYGKHALWSPNTTFASAQSKWVRWYPVLARPGRYEVWVYIPAGVGTTRSALYWISHTGTNDAQPLNQALYADQWVSLGTFDFDASGAEYVLLTDTTYETAQTTKVAADAVRFFRAVTPHGNITLPNHAGVSARGSFCINPQAPV